MAASKSDIRRWFMKKHDKDNDNLAKPAKPEPKASQPEKPSPSVQQEKPVPGGVESSCRRKTSKYFLADKQKPKDKKEMEELPTKRKTQKGAEESLKPPPSKKIRKVVDEDDDNSDDFVLPNSRNKSFDVTANKKLKSSSGRGVSQKNEDIDLSDDEEVDKDTKSPLKVGGRGCGGRGASVTSAGGRDRGGGWGGFMKFGERKDPPHKEEKKVPEGSSDCLGGLTFVISGTLDSLEREEAEDLIKRHGGRITGSISKKTNFLLCDEDIGGKKSAKAKELGTAFLTEDGLFDMIRASKTPARGEKKIFG